METRIRVWTPMSSGFRRMPRAVAGNGGGVVDDKGIRRRHHQPGNGGSPGGRGRQRG